MFALIFTQKHNYFRQIWNRLYQAAQTKTLPPHLTQGQYIQEGLFFIDMLCSHHAVEERSLFPLLGQKMPEFRLPNHPNGTRQDVAEDADEATRRAGILIRHHHQIHKGMEEFQMYLRTCSKSPETLDWERLHRQMDTWGGVLWEHLHLEVETLRAENMRKYWAVEELQDIEF